MSDASKSAVFCATITAANGDTLAGLHQRVTALLAGRPTSAPKWADEMPERPGWYLYRDETGVYLCEATDGGCELTWYKRMPGPGAWSGQWRGLLETPL